MNLEAIFAFVPATNKANINFNIRKICLMVMAYGQVLIVSPLYIICFVKEHNV